MVVCYGLGFFSFPFLHSRRGSTECLSFEKSCEGKLISVIELVSTFAKTKCELCILFGNEEAVKFCEPLGSLTRLVRL